MEPNHRQSRSARAALRAVTTAVLMITFVGFGTLLLSRHLGEDKAGPSAIFAFIHDPSSEPDSAAADVIRGAITTHDWWVIAGYALVFGTCCAAYGLLAFSEAGKKLAPLLWSALGVAIAADVVENVLVLYALDHQNPRLWVSVAATIKWSALLVAAFAVPLAALGSIRLAKSYWSKWRTSRRIRRLGGKSSWCAWVLADVPPQTSESDENQRSWQDAYAVPEVDPQRPTTALCLSGGGVRSACVAMGAMQTFSGTGDLEKPLLDDFDYVISVSGGGYSAGARLLAVQPANTNGTSHGDTHPVLRLSHRYAPGSAEFDHLRRRSSYIADSVAKLIRALAEVIKNLLASLIILFSLAVLIGWAAGWFYAKIPLAADVPDQEPATGTLLSLSAHRAASWVSVALLIGIALLIAALALIVEWASTAEVFTRWRDKLNSAAKAVVLFALVTLTLTVALPGVMYLSSPVVPELDEKPSAIGAIGGVAAVTLVQLIATVVSMVRGKVGGSAEQGAPWWKKLLPPAVVQLVITLGTLTVLLFAWLVALGITGAWVFDDVTRGGNSVSSVTHWKWYWAGIIAVTAFLYFCDVTSLSLHPFYRTRLARAFSVRRINGKAEPYDKCESSWLDEYGRTPTNKPKFIFAAAAAVSGAKKPGPGQNAVSFVLGADFIGGPALGWLRTGKLRSISPARIRRDLTVQAAVATSGAAFASTMGRQSKGLQTLFAASGARLGTWLPNPTFVRNAFVNEGDKSFPKALPSVRGAGYFYRELLGINKSDAALVQVTDGGHYENLGLVEALRRRCRLIYCIDGGGDTPPLLSGLADAIRLAENELGVIITPNPLPDPEQGYVNSGVRFSAAELAPGSAEPYPPAHPFECLNDRLTAGAVIRAAIHYPAASGVGTDNTGVLIFAKATLWKGLPEWVLTHAASKGNENFPHDSTGNQWFNEAQFSAYIEVGRCIAKEAQRVSLPSDFAIPDSSLPPGTASWGPDDYEGDW